MGLLYYKNWTNWVPFDICLDSGQGERMGYSESDTKEVCPATRHFLIGITHLSN